MSVRAETEVPDKVGELVLPKAVNLIEKSAFLWLNTNDESR
jgi:hypothetical protein